MPTVRSETFAWLDKRRLQLRSVGFELLHAGTPKRPAKEIIEAMAARNVFIGRAWPVWPTHVANYRRHKIGDGKVFEFAFQEVMRVQAGAQCDHGRREDGGTDLDGRRVRGDLA